MPIDNLFPRQFRAIYFLLIGIFSYQPLQIPDKRLLATSSELAHEGMPVFGK